MRQKPWRFQWANRSIQTTGFSKRPCTVKKGSRFSHTQTGCHWPNSHWPGISDIPAEDGKISNLFYSVFPGFFVVRYLVWKPCPKSKSSVTPTAGTVPIHHARDRTNMFTNIGINGGINYVINCYFLAKSRPFPHRPKLASHRILNWKNERHFWSTCEKGRVEGTPIIFIYF